MRLRKKCYNLYLFYDHMWSDICVLYEMPVIVKNLQSCFSIFVNPKMYSFKSKAFER